MSKRRGGVKKVGQPFALLMVTNMNGSETIPPGLNALTCQEKPIGWGERGIPKADGTI